MQSPPPLEQLTSFGATTTTTERTLSLDCYRWPILQQGIHRTITDCAMQSRKSILGRFRFHFTLNGLQRSSGFDSLGGLLGNTPTVWWLLEWNVERFGYVIQWPGGEKEWMQIGRRVIISWINFGVKERQQEARVLVTFWGHRKGQVGECGGGKYVVSDVVFNYYGDLFTFVTPWSSSFLGQHVHIYSWQWRWPEAFTVFSALQEASGIQINIQTTPRNYITTIY